MQQQQPTHPTLWQWSTTVAPNSSAANDKNQLRNVEKTRKQLLCSRVRRRHENTVKNANNRSTHSAHCSATNKFILAQSTNLCIFVFQLVNEQLNRIRLFAHQSCKTLVELLPFFYVVILISFIAFIVIVTLFHGFSPFHTLRFVGGNLKNRHCLFRVFVATEQFFPIQLMLHIFNLYRLNWLFVSRCVCYRCVVVSNNNCFAARQIASVSAAFRINCVDQSRFFFFSFVFHESFLIFIKWILLHRLALDNGVSQRRRIRSRLGKGR